MNFRSSIRTKLFLAFTLSALPVILTGLIMVLRHPAQFERIQYMLTETSINLKALRNAHSVIADFRHKKENSPEVLELLSKRIEAGKLNAGLSSELSILLAGFISAPAGINNVKIDTASSLIEQIQFEQESELITLSRELHITAERIQNVQTVQIIIACLLVFLLSVHFGRHFSQPLEKLRESIEKIRSGELGARTEHLGDDELGVVIQAFNDMSEELNKNLISKAYLDSILENIKECVIVIDHNQYIEYVNNSVPVLTGHPIELLVNTPVKEILEGYSAESNSKELLYLVTTTGEKIPVTVDTTAVTSKSNQQRTVLTARDERERLSIRKERDEVNAKLAHNERLASLGTLSGEVAHRLNQPLTSLRLLLQQNRRKVRELQVDDESLQNNIELCLKEISRAADAVKRILTYTRKEQEAKTFVLISEVVARTKLVFSERLRVNSIRLETSGPADLSLYCTESELEELLFILVNNSIDALGPDGGTVSIDWNQFDAGIKLFVTDSGPGIPEEALEKIFEVFYTSKAAGKGTGLGLSIARKIAEDHNGSIQVTNRPEGGAMFMICFEQQPSVSEGVPA